MPNITSFIDSLSKRADSETVTNPYLNEAKAHNLEVYLRAAIEQNVRYLFVGEAPGYKGCNQTGIPFTSYGQLKEGVHPFIDSFAKDIIVTNPNTTETTARIFWEGLIQNDFTAVAWNTFPFHPHVIGETKNRAPIKEEVLEGISFLNALIKIINPKEIISVGGYAYSLLAELNIEHLHVRHPSYDFKDEFPIQIKAIIETIKGNL